MMRSHQEEHFFVEFFLHLRETKPTMIYRCSGSEGERERGRGGE
jgi:hypothetical protein